MGNAGFHPATRTGKMPVPPNGIRLLEEAQRRGMQPEWGYSITRAEPRPGGRADYHGQKAYFVSRGLD